MTVAVRAGGPDGGVLAAEVNLKLIWDVVSQIKIGQNGDAYVVDGHGLLVAHPDISLVLQKTDLSSLEQARQAAASRPRTPADGDRTLIARSLKGERVLSAYEAVYPPGWAVLVEQPLDEAFQTLYASMLRTVVLLLLGLAISIGASVLLARRMVTPIRALQAGADRIGAGELSHQIEVNTGDELEALSESFNAMTTRLRESYEGLEQKVVERTRELHDANEQLAEASRHKSQFLANMSHELRTPLNAIIGYSEMLQEEAEDLDQQSLIPDLQKVNAAGRHLLGLINDILDLSKIEAGRMDLFVKSFEVGQLVQDVAAIVQPLIERNANALVVSCPVEVGSMHADLTKVRQTLFNLLSNAAKFTDHGTITLSAKREPGEGGGWLCFAVTDTGIGMTEEQLERLFEAFSQAEASTRSKYGGTGLGLAISRHFCRLMGGDLTVTSVYGQGSTFTVRLPGEVTEPVS
jgi:signal transduction histidine kinase